jgi:hypothetical protein
MQFLALRFQEKFRLCRHPQPVTQIRMQSHCFQLFILTSGFDE